MAGAASPRKSKGGDAAASQERVGPRQRGVKRDQDDSPEDMVPSTQATSPSSHVSPGNSVSDEKSLAPKRVKRERGPQGEVASHAKAEGKRNLRDALSESEKRTAADKAEKPSGNSKARALVSQAPPKKTAQTTPPTDKDDEKEEHCHDPSAEKGSDDEESREKDTTKTVERAGEKTRTGGEAKKKLKTKGGKAKGGSTDESSDDMQKDGAAKKGGNAAKRAAGKKQAPSLPAEIDELFLKHRALAGKTRKFLGAHISASGGVQNAPLNCLAIGGQAFAFFLKNQRRWDSPPISAESAEGFKAEVAKLKLDGPQHVLPHGSYLINLANPGKFVHGHLRVPVSRPRSLVNILTADRDVTGPAPQTSIGKQAASACARPRRVVGFFRRVNEQYVPFSVLHQIRRNGKCRTPRFLTTYRGASRLEFIDTSSIQESLNKAIAATKSVTILLENMAGQKNVLCSEFEDLRDIIALVDKKDRIGVCLDTCHLFSAGHDIRTEEKFEAVMKKFDSIVGMKYLKAMHINDSKAPLGSGLDRHEHIGKGTLGLAPFKFIMQHPTWFKDMPLVLETPEVDDNGPKLWRKETEMMYKFTEE
ncbi:putative endonuclease V [Neospora caninum Liverpool]|uniref:Putative endonuclease V n=1 Tax=Neospora caninum (strain Liverpool) TaxID=572307 RepID=F0VBQ5_NEOCL|nr:putative endonuclease V [Neospora caninum Liverpool]CBZ51039.1 putative endonuclease V [Neospora caninum Liverpool]|eukprot:XP_003881072.1 putative endonuclease V [Neospora caninum Liverpool]